MKKKYLFIIIASVAIVCAVTISFLLRRSDPGADGGEYTCDFNGNYSEHTVLYLDDSGVLHLIDTDSGKDIVYCDRPNCTHEKYSHTNQNPSCPAVFFGTMICAPVLHGEHLYFIGNMTDEGGLLTQYLYEMDQNGEHRKTVAKIEGVESVSYVLYRDHYAIGGYFNRSEVNDEGQIVNDDKPVAGIFVIDLDNDNVYMSETLTSQQANITGIYYEKDAVYYAAIHFGDDITKADVADGSEDDFEDFTYNNLLYDVYRYDIAKKKTSLIKEFDHINELWLLEGDAYYKSKDGYFMLDKNTAQITELDAIEKMADKKDRDICIRQKNGNDLYFTVDDNNEVSYYRMKGTKVTELMKLPEDDLFIIDNICGSSVYISYYDDERRYCLGVLNTDDFNKGVFHPRRLRYYNEEE